MTSSKSFPTFILLWDFFNQPELTFWILFYYFFTNLYVIVIYSSYYSAYIESFRVLDIGLDLGCE